jgi:hypothetical protein
MKPTSADSSRFSLAAYIKYGLTLLGAGFSSGALQRITSTVNYLALGRWMNSHGFQFSERVKSRHAVFDSVLHQVADRPVLYLEFGVYRGESMRYWSRGLQHPETQLHGFDSFEGLPESGGLWTKGEFDVQGTMPEINDARVRFFKGWFEDVLPEYSLPDHDVLVINMDADLYSSTLYVLRYLRPHIRPGTFIYFDDLPAIEQEPRALHEFLAESDIRLQPVCANLSLEHAFFKCVADKST